MKKIILAVVAFLAMLSVASCSFMDNSVEALKFVELPAETVLQGEASTLVAKVQVISSDSTKTYSLEVGATAHQVLVDGAAVADPGFVVEGAEGLAAGAAKGSYVLKLTLSGITLIHNYRVVGSDAEVLFAAGSGTSEDPYLIETAQQLFNIRYAYDTVGGKYFKLGADIDLHNFKWIAIGTALKPFTGHLDGDGHSIIGMTNALTDSSENEQFVPSSTKVSGDIFGIFGYAGASNATVEVKNLKVLDASLDAGFKAAAVLIGSYCDVSGVVYENAVLKVENVTVSGTIKGKDKIAGFLGQAAHRANSSSNLTYEFTNCVNEVNVIATLDEYNRAAGFIGQFTADAGRTNYVKFTNCVNKGNITVTSHDQYALAGDFIGHFNGNPIKPDTVNGLAAVLTAKLNDKLVIEMVNCSNTGVLTANGNSGFATPSARYELSK